MKQMLVVTVVGPDRPGIVARLAEVVAAHGADWLKSHMAQLAGQFAGIVQIEVEDELHGELAGTLRALADETLTVTVVEGEEDTPAAAESTRTLSLELTGLDHPGIVRDIGAALSARGVGIVELETERVSGSMSGETLFRARATLAVPGGISDEMLDETLQAVSSGLMMDLGPAE